MRTLDQAGNLFGKKVLLRCDFNITIDENGKILDDFKIRASLPTIEYLLKNEAKIILMSHLGRPEGKVVEKLRLDPIAKRLQELLNRPVKKLPDNVSEEVEKEIKEIQSGEIILLENIQFNPGETKNDSSFAKTLSSYADIFIMDAFGQSHRNYASIAGVTKYLPSFAGLLLQKEVETLSRVLNSPGRPLLAVIGGAKISTKIKLIQEYLKKADNLVLGGALANTVLHAKGIAVGSSIIEEDVVPQVQKFEITDTKLHIPVDVIVSTDKTGTAQCKVGPVGKTEPGEMILDIGPETEKVFDNIVKSAKMVIWNGAMGVFEVEAFAHGTKAMAESIASCPDCFSIVGGGETICLIGQMGLIDKFSHVSTGGGAMLEFLAGEKLPGIEALNHEYCPNKSRISHE